MILIFDNDNSFTKDLKKSLKIFECPIEIHNGDSLESFEVLYKRNVKAIVTSENFSLLPKNAWIDLLNSLGNRVPIICRTDKMIHNSNGNLDSSTTITFLNSPTVDSITEVLKSFPELFAKQRFVAKKKIPMFNSQIPRHMLGRDGALSIITIDASAFRKIAIEYGSETYFHFQKVFQKILFDLWGAPGSFRKDDILCKKSSQSNIYFLFIQQSRSSASVPEPGITEKLANRISYRLQGALWDILGKSKYEGVIPAAINFIPEIKVGYATCLYNPCVDAMEAVDRLIQKSFQVAMVQFEKGLERQTELMQTLIQSEGLLYPEFQGIFRLDLLKKEHFEESKAQNSLAPLKHLLFGFESLIRVKKSQVLTCISKNDNFYMGPNTFRPDILFKIAKETDVTLELDQACLRHALAYSGSLPGQIMINILPRNLYYIDRILPVMNDYNNIIFEVSESEDISNFDLIMEVKSKLKQRHMGIAADDFGKGYTGVERILKIQPDIIKLDRSLIVNIDLDKSRQSFVKGLVEAANNSGSVVLAEGVETWNEAEVLQKMGIYLIQGFLLHRPQEVKKILKSLNIAPGTAKEDEDDSPEKKSSNQVA